MKKRCLAALPIFILALLLRFQYEKEILLADRYPAILIGEYQADIEWAGSTGFEANVCSEEFRSILAKAKVKKYAKSEKMPDVAFDVHMIAEHTTYLIVIGKDNTISVANLSDSDFGKTRTFWLDCDGRIFEELYTCHLNNGGTAVPEI